MELLSTLLDFILHPDHHLSTLLTQYGAWVYGILFLIVFAETGLVVTPFLPGDSLLFVAGTLTGAGQLDVRVLMAVLFLAEAELEKAVLKEIGRASCRERV